MVPGGERRLGCVGLRILRLKNKQTLGNKDPRTWNENLESVSGPETRRLYVLWTLVVPRWLDRARNRDGPLSTTVLFGKSHEPMVLRRGVLHFVLKKFLSLVDHKEYCCCAWEVRDEDSVYYMFVPTQLHCLISSCLGSQIMLCTDYIETTTDITERIISNRMINLFISK